ncbi:polysaccharide deacetylase family protein [Brevundimonas subvibrioides]|uniref:polysaccharide deacetylase family protein n=1 Tax=Brevundimonas subvibrioides TaxID=74313 RepID=UPI0022B4CD78|nr:polysaccharide deacetylase family protein [Brevundimonas subvibrioides]
MNRRQLLSGFLLGTGGLLSACGHLSAGTDTRPQLAITIDDFNMGDGPLMTGAQKHEAILRALKAAGIQAAGFVTGKYIDNDPARRHLEAWVADGHLVGNHTYRHAYHGGAEPGDLAADIDDVAVLIKDYATWRPLFRFPYLAEGSTTVSRDAHRAVLAARGLKNAYVTIDASDWYVSDRLIARLRRDPGADVTPYGDFLVAHLLSRARFYDALARDVLGFSPPHTLLIHHNLTTALFLPRILSAFSDAGWAAIDADTAFAHPVYASQPDIAPCANSLIWQLSSADGRFAHRLRTPGEDGPYEQSAMDALGL